ncbi:protein delta homolog 1-like [Littorina saxatilis]|uniref:protein delta homolog 1-like n=1 Tax=Littorina saxatilis TaxID=31220 RepID=UPI0038B47F5C
MMFATQLFLILSVATVVLGQGRVCTYVDQQDMEALGMGLSVVADTLEACKAACEANVQCVALEFGFFTCNLNTDLPDTSPQIGITFSIATCTTADPCTSDPCQNGATCIGNATAASFDCICPFGFAGDTCQIECDFSCPSPKACLYGSFQLVDPQDGTCPDFTCVESKRENVYNRKRGSRRYNRRG